MNLMWPLIVHNSLSPAAAGRATQNRKMVKSPCEPKGRADEIDQELTPHRPKAPYEAEGVEGGFSVYENLFYFLFRNIKYCSYL